MAVLLLAIPSFIGLCIALRCLERAVWNAILKIEREFSRGMAGR